MKKSVSLMLLSFVFLAAEYAASSCSIFGIFQPEGFDKI